jgi:hypothetical protein
MKITKNTLVTGFVVILSHLCVFVQKEMHLLSYFVDFPSTSKEIWTLELINNVLMVFVYPILIGLAYSIYKRSMHYRMILSSLIILVIIEFLRFMIIVIYVNVFNC